MKRTLLELTQLIAASIGSDEINSITDSVEAQDIVKIIRQQYEEIWERSDLPEHYGTINLTASGDPDYPVIMTVPERATNLIWVKYDNANTDDTDVQMREVKYLPFAEFAERMYLLDASATDVDTFSYELDDHTFTVLHYNNRAPVYYTSVDDNVLLFDGYDSDVDGTLQSSKSQAYAKFEMPWTDSDTFVPDLDGNLFPLLINEAKSLAWAELRQTVHQKAEQSASRGWVRLQRSKERAAPRDYYHELPNYGRK